MAASGQSLAPAGALLRLRATCCTTATLGPAARPLQPEPHRRTRDGRDRFGIGLPPLPGAGRGAIGRARIAGHVSNAVGPTVFRPRGTRSQAVLQAQADLGATHAKAAEGSGQSSARAFAEIALGTAIARPD